jgi:hypothetical protein
MINRHLRHPLELWENTGKRFLHRNAKGQDRSGLYDNAGVPDLYPAKDPTVNCGGSTDCPSGLYLWHSECRDWRLWYLKAHKLDEELPFEMSVPEPGLGRVAVKDLPDKCEANNPPPWEDPEAAQNTQSLRLTLGGKGPDTVMLRSPEIATRLQIRQLGKEPIPMYLGGSRSPELSGHAALWTQDNHGMAWLDVLGSPAPELYISRGASVGKLHWPGPAKPDALYLGLGGETLYMEAPPGVVPTNYCSSRQVAWADVDGTGGVGALTISCEGQPNRLLTIEGGRLVDRADELGLSGCDAKPSHKGRDENCNHLSFAWTDVDEDGLLDHVRSVGMTPAEGLKLELLSRTKTGEPWRAATREDLSLRGGDTLQASCAKLQQKYEQNASKSSECTVVPPVLQVVDMNRDGLLDLWAAGYGLALLDAQGKAIGGAYEVGGVTLLLKRRDQAGRVYFVDATPEGMRAESLVAADFDNDGWMDLLVGDGEALSFRRNITGQSTQAGGVLKLDAPLRLSSDIPSLNTAVLDVNNDCRLDVVATGADKPNPNEPTKKTLVSLLNETPGAKNALVLDLKEPPGTLVKGFYRDGGILAQQVGATQTSRYSQGNHPLVFGTANSNALTCITRQRPGHRASETIWSAPGERCDKRPVE